MIKKAVMQGLVTAVVVAVSATIGLVAAAFALFAELRGPWGETLAATAVAGLFAVVALGVVLWAGRKAAAPKQPVQPVSEPAPILTTLMSIAREKPLVSAAVAAVAGIIAVRNPQIVSSLVKAFFDDGDPPA